jgi:hypothetical protein
MTVQFVDGNKIVSELPVGINGLNAHGLRKVEITSGHWKCG